MTYAIQLSDLVVLQTHHPVFAMILPPLMEREPLDLDPRLVVGLGTILLFACSDEQAAAMIDVIRSRLSYYECRCYQRVGKKWKRA